MVQKTMSFKIKRNIYTFSILNQLHSIKFWHSSKFTSISWTTVTESLTIRNKVNITITHREIIK